MVGIGQGQWRYGEDMLAGHTQERAAGDQQGDARTTGQEIDQNRSGRQHVLEVVQDQEELSWSECACEGGGGRLASRLHDTKRLGDPRRYAVVVAYRRELDERDLVEAGVEIHSDVNRQPSLAYASGSGQRDQPRRGIED